MRSVRCLLFPVSDVTLRRPLGFFITCLIVMAGIMAASAASGAESKKLLGTFRDWDAFLLERSDQTICYMVSMPKDTSPDNVRRGQTYVTVTHSPKRKAYDEVNVVAGYPYRDDSTVTFNIDGRNFELFTSGDAAWAYDAESDGRIVGAMKQGATLRVTGLSSRGTTTRDRYSLMGFTAAHKAISNACGR